MKVDKAVCTTDTMTDVEKAISYENLLSSLVQKKILAIKRECEAKKVAKRRRKQQNCLGSLIFGSRHNRSNRCDDSSSKEAAIDIDPPSISQQESKIVIDSKKIMKKINDNQEPVNSITNIHVNEIPLMKTENILTECHIDVLNERGSCNNDNNTTQRHDPLHCDFHCHAKYSRRCMDSGDDQNAHSTHSKISDNSVIEVDIESTSVAATNSKCPSIVSQIEGNDEMNAMQKLRSRKNSCDSISVPSSLKHTTLSEPADEMALLDHKQRYQIHLLEAKSISAQCSPILAQRQTFNVSASGRVIKSPLTQKMIFDTSDDNVTAANVPTSNRSGTSNENNQCKENIDETDECCSSQAKSTMMTTTTTKRNSKPFFKKKDKVSNANNEVHGFISSFNQLTSKNLPVITSATKTMAKHVTSNKCERGNHCTVDDTNDISVVSNKKATQDDNHSKYKRTHRYSEPMLVYPSSNRLQQCILSMPTSQPIQLRYNDELMYDVSLKMETDRSTDFTGDRRRRHRKHRHRHHHHHHNNGRKNRHKRKILLHDLDEQTVKVIDPEDMSQRARLTIIFTACLLLLMCLLLVGVTLRMAPLIDDMVRQENERIQESINRGKFGRNMTHGAFIGQQYQQQSQHP
ncbi:uncharacterized protein LOC116338380 [Contarinia nasturtii]|uniref:uncharacterized protein LOC116338380 n=1 Tax=Contarinia nasturtii TaxID=265458 RepID=UPI0012D3C7D8|nr:uncharacterized protein LOC116338380 [Contarinia nasturtii]